jgi:hypothetical protein
MKMKNKMEVQEKMVMMNDHRYLLVFCMNFVSQLVVLNYVLLLNYILLSNYVIIYFIVCVHMVLPRLPPGEALDNDALNFPAPGGSIRKRAR